MASDAAAAQLPVAIIGAGLGGLTLALALHKSGIRTKIFELRTPAYDFGGAIMLSPNALRVLDSIDAYQRLRTKGFNFSTLTFMTDHDFKITGKYYFGDEQMYGYSALRIYRKVLIAELRDMVHERGIEIQYGRKFRQIVEESENGVRFAFDDGSEEEAQFLIGADGIHSTVRKYLSPEIVPKYASFLGVTFAFPASKVRFPPGQDDFPVPVSIHGKNGAFVLAPQNTDGQEMFAGRQFKYPMQDRSGWDALLKEKSELISMHQSDMEEWSDVVRSAQEQISSPEAHGLSIWPYHTVPKLDSWASDRGRVILIGDAAHAIPPTAGQGANQAFEDSYSLSIVLKSVSHEFDLKAALTAWHKYRQARIDKVLILSDQMNNLRLPEADKKLINQDQIWHDESGELGEGGQLGWLYLHKIEEDMTNLLGQ